MSRKFKTIKVTKPGIFTLVSIVFITTMIFVGISCVGEYEKDTIEETDVQSLEIPLIYHMGFMSRYAKKLYFAGQAENWELADLYSHEIEEVAEDIIDGGYIHHDLNMGDLINIKLLPQVERLEEAIDKKDLALFTERYEILVQSCNSCHVASDYGMVKVIVPERHTFNQDFSVTD